MRLEYTLYVVGSKPVFDRTIEDKPMISYTGCAITFDVNSINVKFTDNKKNIISENEYYCPYFAEIGEV